MKRSAGLFYVAMTRAKDSLAIYTTAGTGEERSDADQVPAGVHAQSGLPKILAFASGSRGTGRSVCGEEEKLPSNIPMLPPGC